jgi:hypothetical protein
MQRNDAFGSNAAKRLRPLGYRAGAARNGYVLGTARVSQTGGYRAFAMDKLL